MPFWRHLGIAGMPLQVTEACSRSRGKLLLFNRIKKALAECVLQEIQ